MTTRIDPIASIQGDLGCAALAKRRNCFILCCSTRARDGAAVALKMVMRTSTRAAAALALSTFFFTSACSAHDDGDGAQPDAVSTATGSTFIFSAAKGELPDGASFAFSDYPEAEDADARAPTRVEALARIDAQLQTKLGRPGLLAEWSEYEAVLGYPLHAQGYWLNARFEKVVATDMAPSFVLSHINRGGAMNTNLLFDVADLTKNAAYDVTATLVLRTNAPAGCFGFHGAPESIAYRVTFSQSSWGRTVDTMGHWRMTNRLGGSRALAPNDTVDTAKLGGAPMALGTIGAPHATECAGFNAYEDVTLSATGLVKTDATGALHGLLSTHSGFEGMSVWGVRMLKVTLRRR